MNAPSPQKLLGVLEKIGLTVCEAKVYLSCLKLGVQAADVIATDAGLSSADAATILERLHDRGFLSRFATNRDFFCAEPPEVLIRLLESREFEQRQGIEEFRTCLPLFAEFANPAFTKPEIAFYNGKEGVIAAYEDTLTSKTDILAITSIDDTESVLPEYVPRYYLRRKAAGILIRAIFPDTPMSRSRQARDAEELRESRLVPRSFLEGFHLEYYIYDDKVAYFSIVEGIAVIVKSSFIAQGMRTVFSMLWQLAPGGAPYDASASRRTDCL
ncbi:MAG: helix-turn-helix domain-containing protein [Candidatus Peribacteraceae bacterium]|nr:helix-turn-helix domain-containing protein [Candidatus Peribacteraceae bacterium]